MPARSITKLPPDLLSVSDAARRLGVSANTAYAAVRRGELPGAVRIGRQWRISVPALERYLHGDQPAAEEALP